MGYKETFACFVLMSVVLGYVKSQPDTDVCMPGPGDPHGHRLPEFPDHFKVDVHSNIVNRDYSLITTEIYDYENNRGTIWSVYPGKTLYPFQQNGRRTYYDYDLGQYFTTYPNVTDFGTHTCTTGMLSNHSHSPFGYDHGHIQNAKDIYRFGDMYNETYMGQKNHSGQMLDWWNTCIYDERRQYTYTLDFFFTAGEEKATLPVAIIMNGTAPLNWSDPHSEERRWFYHVYRFENVDLKKQDGNVFYPPIGVLCPGRAEGKKVPKIPKAFELNVELINPDEKEIVYVKEFYQYGKKIAAYQYSPAWSDDRDYPKRAVHDYSTGIEYRITADEKCEIRPIPTYSMDAVVSDDKKHIYMKRSASFFVLDKLQWAYEGWTTTRDAKIEAWQALRTDWKPWKHRHDNDLQVNSTWLYYFMDKDWKIDGNYVYNKNGETVPIRLEVIWVAYNNQTGKFVDRGKDIHNYFATSEEAFVKYTYFNVDACYTRMNESMHVAFNLDGKDTYMKYFVNNTIPFYNGIHDSISDSIDVSIARITNVQVVEGYKGITTIFFTLLDRPRVEGDSLNATDPGPALKTAYSLLDNLINSKEGSQMVIEFPFHDHVHKVYATSGTLREETAPLIQTQQVGLTNGVVAGVAIGTFILGAAIAAVCSCVVFKYKTREIPYGVQE